MRSRATRQQSRRKARLVTFLLFSLSSGGCRQIQNIMAVSTFSAVSTLLYHIDIFRPFYKKGGTTMRWSWRLGNVAGITGYVHVTFVLLVGRAALSHWLNERSLTAALAGSAFILVLFG